MHSEANNVLPGLADVGRQTATPLFGSSTSDMPMVASCKLCEVAVTVIDEGVSSEATCPYQSSSSASIRTTSLLLEFTSILGQESARFVPGGVGEATVHCCGRICRSPCRCCYSRVWGLSKKWAFPVVQERPTKNSATTTACGFVAFCVSGATTTAVFFQQIQPRRWALLP